jgi:3'-5' exonuclease
MRKLFFDIETAPDMSVPDELLPKEEDLKLGNVKDPEKRAAAVEEKLAKEYERMGLTPLTGRVIAIGYKIDGKPAKVLFGQEEYQLILSFWDAVRKALDDNWAGEMPTLITFNGKSFDLPYLWLASVRHGIVPALDYTRYSAKYRDDHLDLKMFLSDNFGMRGTLSDWAIRYGIKAPEGSGKEIFDLFVAGNWKAIAKHCKDDVEVLAKLFDKVGLLFGGNNDNN